MEKARASLYAPLEGTREAKRAAQNRSLAAAGLDLKQVQEMMRKRAERKAAESAAS